MPRRLSVRAALTKSSHALLTLDEPNNHRRQRIHQPQRSRPRDIPMEFIHIVLSPMEYVVNKGGRAPQWRQNFIWGVALFYRSLILLLIVFGKSVKMKVICTFYN